MKVIVAFAAMVLNCVSPSTALADPTKGGYSTAEAAERLQGYGLKPGDAKAVALAFAGVGGAAPQTVKMFEMLIPALATRSKLRPDQVATDVAAALKGQWAAAERLEIIAKILSPRAREALQVIVKAGRGGDAAHLYLDILFSRSAKDARAAVGLKFRQQTEEMARSNGDVAAFAIICGMPEKVVYQVEVATITLAVTAEDVSAIRRIYADAFWARAMTSPELPGDLCAQTRALVERIIGDASVK